MPDDVMLELAEAGHFSRNPATNSIHERKAQFAQNLQELSDRSVEKAAILSTDKIMCCRQQPVQIKQLRSYGSFYDLFIGTQRRFVLV